MMSKKLIEKISLIAILVAIASIPLYVIVHVYGGNKEQETEEAQYVGKETCIECHLTEYNDWVGSDHDKAMDFANDSTVLGDFDNQSLEYNGITHKMYKRGGKFYVLTDGETGKPEEFEVKYVFGYYPLQQYMVEFDRGRVQVLPITWDSKNNKWYHMADAIYKDENIDYTNWLHWTNQAQNWNSMCADCHSTNLKKGYDLKTDSYHTTFSEMDVSCEACHGPASKHLEWAAKSEFARKDDDNYGLVVKTSGIDNKQYVDLCVRCHARRASIDDFEPDADLYNHCIPNLPTGENYHIDGQILSEDYVYGSFTQSKMYMRDVKCNDCHNVHSTKRLYEDNRLCTQCHRADDYDTYKHHFHKFAGEPGKAVIADDGVKFDVGTGTRCINCHMPAQFYMGVDYRNDHSIRIPRPDLTKTMGTPNACNQCHADKSTDWAISYMKQWYGESSHYQYGEAFYEAQTGSAKGFDDLVRIYKDETYPEIVRATAIQFLGMNYPDSSKAVLLDALGNANNHIKYNAVHSLNVFDDETIPVLLKLLKDPTRAIRIESASKLTELGQDHIPEKYKEDYKEANAEYFAMLEYNADFPTGKFNLANYYYNNKDVKSAETFYKKALRQDSLLHPVKINLALLYSNQKEYDKAEQLFKDYLNYNPTDGHTIYLYALLLSEMQRYDESLEMLLESAKYSPNNARVFYNIAMMYDFKKDKSRTEKYLKKSVELQPDNPNYYMVLLNHYMKFNNVANAKSTAKSILEKFPNIEHKEEIQKITQR